MPLLKFRVRETNLNFAERTHLQIGFYNLSCSDEFNVDRVSSSYNSLVEITNKSMCPIPTVCLEEYLNCELKRCRK